MRRELDTLGSTTFDLLIIGGGIHGAWAAWDATLRGLHVALVDKGDFGGETSANSLKIMHGGLRYLQQADFPRMRESIRERATLARVAPHLVRPMPFLVATDRDLMRSRAAFRAAFRITELIGYDHNRGLAPEAAIPAGRTLPPDECLRLFPGFGGEQITGGAIWYDYQLHDSERLPLALALGAGQRGACVTNYVAVEELLVRDRAVLGARARDVLEGKEFEIRARAVLNAAGPWAARLVTGLAPGSEPHSQHPPVALAINLVSRRAPLDVGVAIRAKSTAAQDPVCGGGRFLFLMPWRRSTLIGTAYHICRRDATAPEVREEQLQALVNECNVACPALELTLDDVTFYHRGLLPLKAGRERGRPDALAGRTRITDHEREHGIRGLISVEGVKYTTARRVAEHAIDLSFRRLGKIAPPCRTAETPLPKNPRPVAAGAAPLVRKGVIQAVRSEMALKLTDVVFRRTGLGAEACPPRDELTTVAELCGTELGWSDARREAEIREVLATYAPLRSC